ncbi:MmcQ/YjbR family DNA-binding protein [Streptomyces canus]|uniref:MmcQ/YjbR family DNA-binding protein n=1 Tax=Streptomyces canus TaxID=58343 RepID=UPI003722420B
MAVPRNALKTWEKVREFALGLPGAAEPRGGAAHRHRPWGETVAKVNKKVFVFLGVSDGSYPMGVMVKLKDAEAHAHAAADLLCDWVEESYRAIAPKRLIAELDTR